MRALKDHLKEFAVIIKVVRSHRGALHETAFACWSGNNSFGSSLFLSASELATLISIVNHETVTQACPQLAGASGSWLLNPAPQLLENSYKILKEK